MSAVRTFMGALVGSAAAGIAWRVRGLLQEEGMTASRVSDRLPGVLRADLLRMREAARGALVDGRRASQAAQERMEQVLAEPRRTDDRDV